MTSWGWVAAALVACGAIAIGGCSDSPKTATAGGTLDVAASFYPLQFVTERVGGDYVSVDVLTKPGAEPHDIELTPRDVAAVQDDDLVVYLRGFQAAVDSAVTTNAGGRALDVAPAAKLIHAVGGEEPGTTDPHFWLDPQRLADVGDAVAARLGAIDATRASAYTSNAAALRRDLRALDGEFTDGLRDCATNDLVTSHEAFAYLARRYGLSQVGIAGLDPEAEPSSAEQAKAVEVIRSKKVATVFTEPLVDSSIADTVAGEAGAHTAVLDPIEGINERSKGNDYLSVMRSNLTALREGLQCR